MFTGIIRSLGVVAALEKREALLCYAIDCSPDFLTGIELGASIAVDGVCQTVVALEGNLVWFEAIEETLQKTTLKALNLKAPVNLERSARIGDEIGGHLLSGHIYATALITKIEKNIFTFQSPPQCLKYLFSKGYVALDGISLTLVSVDLENHLFTVHLIPETLKRTTLSQKTVGSRVNLELDSLVQAVVETIERQNFVQKAS